MNFQISVHYEIVTEESAEQGEAEETGTDVDREVWPFRDVIRKLQECSELSGWRMSRLSDFEAHGHVWASTYPDVDYRTGDARTESVHVYQANGQPLTARQAFRLYRAAGLLSR